MSAPDLPQPDALAFYDPERTTITEAIITTPRAQGCTCAPEVTIANASAFLRPDPDCVLLRRRDVN